jgi:serine/threonine protein phosphatase PrpC
MDLRLSSGDVVSAHSVQGPRPTQQDRWVVEEVQGALLLAVFDGHGGEDAADRAAHALRTTFESFKTDPAPASLRKTLASLEALTHDLESGSTASLVWISADRQTIHGAVLGDSPIALRDRQDQFLSPPLHNVRGNSTELQAALAKGAVLSNGYLMDPTAGPMGLQMSRALGDRSLNRVLNREPELFSASLGPRSLVLVGSDGLLGLGDHGPQMTRLIDLLSNGAVASELVEDALSRGTGDNVSAIAWRAAGWSSGSAKRGAA